MADRPRVVIVGAGFGGLAAAKALRKVQVDVTVVDRHNYHLFQPLLYQVATGLLDPSQIAAPIRSILRRAKNVDVVMGEVLRIDLEAHHVITDSVTLEYDFLVLATGSVSDFFGNEHLREHAFGLKHLEEAIVLRGHLLRCFERAAVCSDAAARRRLLTFAVVGAGPTGVEYSGAVAELIKHVLPRDYPHIDFDEVSVLLIEGGGHVLSGYTPRLERFAQRTLERKRVRILLNHLVRDAADGELVLDGGARIPAETIVWTAGVRGEPALETAALQRTRSGRVEVTTTLQVPDHPEVIAIGDIAAGSAPGEPLPMVAQVAIQGGRHAAATIRARLHRRPDPVFRYHDKGTMATIGRGRAVAMIGPIHVAGLPAWLLWLFVHLVYLVGYRSRFIAIASWAANFFFWTRPVRLIIGSEPFPSTDHSNTSRERSHGTASTR